MATLPTESGGINATNGQDVSAFVISNLGLSAASDLNVGSSTFTINNLGIRASY
jgi:hypothetical protein